MKTLVAIHILLAVSITLGFVGWLYPLNNGAVGLIFLMANAVSVLLVAILKKMFFKGAKNEDTA